MLKRLFMLSVVALTLATAGCAQLQSVLTTATSGVTNPISSTDIYRVKNVYAATLQLAVEYRTYCWSKSYAAIVADPVMKPVCQNRRQVVRTIQSAQVKAGSAVRQADAFVKNNPTVNAATVVQTAWTAVVAFQNSIPAH